YGVRRFRAISTSLLAAADSGSVASSLEQMLEIGSQATVQIVNEAFWVGAAACGLAIVGAIWLAGKASEPRRPTGNHQGSFTNGA
ncbi:MAG: hypothetical protein GQ526_10670, partial [Ardenticatenales bacterium]|nr:hypothetical protein [Ardenticatenales bacterium]